MEGRYGEGGDGIEEGRFWFSLRVGRTEEDGDGRFGSEGSEGG